MLGYYLGGGSVKVDCLFDTANFVTKSAAGNFIANGALGVGGAADPAARLHVRGGGAGAAQARVESSATQANVAFYKDRQSVVLGKRVSVSVTLGGRRIIKKTI